MIFYRSVAGSLFRRVYWPPDRVPHPLDGDSAEMEGANDPRTKRFN